MTLGHKMTPRMYWDQPSLSYWSTGINQCNFYWKQCCGSLSFRSGPGSADPKKIQTFFLNFFQSKITKSHSFVIYELIICVHKTKSYFFLKIIWYSYNFSRFFYVLPGFSGSVSWFYEVDQDPYPSKWSGSRWIRIHKTDCKLY